MLASNPVLKRAHYLDNRHPAYLPQVSGCGESAAC